MGRVKGTHLKRMAKQLVKGHSSSFTEDFDKNKRKIDELKIVGESKTERNKLAGAVTSLKRTAKRVREAREKESA
ncbi:hypothetical protein AUJ65_04990 [Candidatus Micrarchaeota archaeon CG1_02_51_15]|nr:MAG: hypothetical protein AUJ65_04990 [Candidatus Micrarchaeota archaeon CG1_02_51_15]